MEIDWTQVLVTAITTAGAVTASTLPFVLRHSRRAAEWAENAKVSADIALRASQRTPNDGNGSGSDPPPFPPLPPFRGG